QQRRGHTQRGHPDPDPVGVVQSGRRGRYGHRQPGAVPGYRRDPQGASAGDARRHGVPGHRAGGQLARRGAGKLRQQPRKLQRADRYAPAQDRGGDPQRRDGDAGRPDQRQRQQRQHRRAGAEPLAADRLAVRHPIDEHRPQRSDRAADPFHRAQPATGARPHGRVRAPLPRDATTARHAVPRGAERPIVLLPDGTDDDALDACLAALDAGTPAGTRVWLADDAQAGPRGLAIIERWLASTRLAADYSRRQRALGAVAHIDEALSACGDADVAVLAPDAIPAPGWLAQLSACFARDPAIATATPWCNAGEAAAWPRVGEIAPVPGDLERIARACAAMPPRHPELPAAVAHAVLLRGNARKRTGGPDGASFGSWYAALVDLSLRLAGMGWRNVLCDTAFVARGGEGVPADGDLDVLAARWPGWHPRLAEFLMQDPVGALREELSRRHANIDGEPPQAELDFSGA